jgi:D-alanyl-lipoteichoic acid acyltransferase DltB (MBOAT superfamily)
MSAPVLLVATAAFAFQLYLDFSAYTDIAIGTARLLGVRLVENFNWPFISVNPGEFWSRWHMSLTTWFRDYPYRALGGTLRGRPWRTLFNILLVFALMGLWHGAAWHFVLFGLLGGSVLAGWQLLRIATARMRRPGVGLFGDFWWSRPLAWMVGAMTINSLMMIFRVPDLHTAGVIVQRVFGPDWAWQPKYDLYLAMVVGLYLVHWIRGRWFPDRERVWLPAPLRGAMWAGLIVALVFGAVETTEQFIYFQF